MTRPAMEKVIGCLVAIASLVVPTAAQQVGSVARLLDEESVKAAVAGIRTNEPKVIADQIRFCETPAPPFKEAARGALLRNAFAELGLRNVRVDRVGNVLGDRPGATARPRLVVAAHLDTVFPEGTDVRVKRDGALLHGAGIGDDCRGLAVLVSVVRALRDANVSTPGSITFVANVGEEGLGDLRGMKALFGETMKDQIDRFVSIDGTGLAVVTIGVGSRRYRVTFKGPGGHSFGAFGLPNPIDALGRAVAKIAEFQVPARPSTTFNIGRIGGGTSVNSIPAEAWMEVDLRSSEQATLASLDAKFLAVVDAAAVDENTRWGRPGVLTVTKELVGDRPAGSIPMDAPIVQTVQAAGRALGLTIGIAEGSTDANVPMNLRIPAVTIGGGGMGHDAHTLTESFDTSESWKGTAHALLVTIALARP